MRQLLRAWARRARKGGGAPRGRAAARPRLEHLEDRLAPAVLEVVGTNGNGSATFNTFAQAYAASTSPGDVIQIEPSSGTAGPVTLTDPNKALTVQGDPNFDNRTEVVDSATISVNNARLLHLTVNGPITVGAGSRGALVSDSRISSFTETAGSGNGGNMLERDDVSGTVTFQGGGTTATASTGDTVEDSSFESGALVQVGTAGAATSGVTLRDNTFDPSPNTLVAITDSQNVTLDGDKMTLTTASDVITVNNTVASLPVTGLRVVRSDPRSQQGTGIHVIVTTPGESLSMVLEGNAFQGNRIAVLVSGNADLAPGSVIDAGGGGQSQGGNEFRLDVAQGINVSDPAITANHLTVFASGNSVFPGVPTVAVTSGSVSVPSFTNLSESQSIAASFYHNFLSHTPTPGELNFWAPQITSGSAASAVADAIMSSPEAAAREVNELYNALLGRDADPLGLAFFGSQIEGGASEEQVIAQILASNEFALRANALEGTPGNSANLNFIRALYDKLLGRTNESSFEDNYWLAQMSARGRLAVATAFLQSPEFRFDYVESLYTDYTSLPPDSLISSTAPDMLCRSNPPSPAEVNFWVNSGLSLDKIVSQMASSPEYFAVR